MLKLEPREADLLAVPAPEALQSVAEPLAALRPSVSAALQSGRLGPAVDLVDAVVLRSGLGLSASDVAVLRDAAMRLHSRRIARGGGVRTAAAPDPGR